MSLISIFKIRYEASPELLELLNKTTLGTNGAMYRHLDTNERILEADEPLFLSVERHEKIIGNATFCRRENHWYVRYFAFNSSAQASTKKNYREKGPSILKRELNTFFENVLEGKHSKDPIGSIYAYIDPRNYRSKWMSENFGFKIIAQLATQSFSRLHPKKSNRLEILEDWKELEPVIQDQYGKHAFYYSSHSQNPPIYVLRDENKKIIAAAKTTKVNWEIVRLPGKMGGVLTKIIPFTPFLNKLIRPKKHTFIVPEIVYSSNNDPKLVDELFNGILHAEKCNLILWWIDQKDPIYTSIRSKINWGIFHKLIGVNSVDVMERKNPAFSKETSGPVFVSGWDMI